MHQQSPRSSRLPLSLILFALVPIAAPYSLAFDTGPRWTVLREQAILAARRGSFEEAESLLRSSLKSLPGQQNVAAVVLWNEIGNLHQNQLRLSDAEQDFQRALSINSSLPQPDDLQTAIALNDLGTMAGQTHDPGKAETLLRQAYRLIERAGKTESETAALVHSNLALTLQQQGRYPEARLLYGRAAPSVKALYGENSVEYARIVSNRALLNFETGAYQDALADAKSAAAIGSRLAYLSRADRALICNNLGYTLSEFGQWAEAEAALLEAIRIEDDLPDGYKQLVYSLNNLAALEEKQGQLKSAKEHGLRALHLTQQRAEVATITLAAIWNNLGRIAASERDYSQARKCYGKAIALWTDAGVNGSPRFAATVSNLAGLESAQRHRREAEALYRRALAIDESKLGPDHPAVASDLANLASQLFYRKRSDDALELYQRARRIQEKSFGPASLPAARTWRNMAVVYRSSKRFDEAARAYSKAIELLTSFSGGKDPSLSAWLREYAESLRKNQRFSEAEAADTRALGIEVRNTLASQRQSRNQIPQKDGGKS